MWDPGFEFENWQYSLLKGYHRSPCILSKHYRGTERQPGLILGLDQGGQCEGILYSINEKNKDGVLENLRKREAPLSPGIYKETWVKVQVGRLEKKALAFVANQENPFYVGKISESERIKFLVGGRGTKGTSLEYFQNVIYQLQHMGVNDLELEKFVQRAEAMAGRMILCGEESPRALAS